MKPAVAQRTLPRKFGEQPLSQQRPILRPVGVRPYLWGANWGTLLAGTTYRNDQQNPRREKQQCRARQLGHATPWSTLFTHLCAPGPRPRPRPWTREDVAVFQRQLCRASHPSRIYPMIRSRKGARPCHQPRAHRPY
ncbi:hypothetical protein FOIG_16134 [Fusarium odoratissimum NRRL 54006]|uniref:Uncharacterized protein n=1 Tax=Fusarium odoratissimum (strain NRRL 54006) TaxID=1089451 RepID=X0K0R8_FUSO5|nr:uncharacterized protein FOIG_16134 [Fusarium odoratissimum NRRL 54006]EXL90674.1 hypothetical protein FOIG_16134 [Fusarium odoratissimum NRRL 54006]